jgi:hypothetical protein
VKRLRRAITITMRVERGWKIPAKVLLFLSRAYMSMATEMIKNGRGNNVTIKSLLARRMPYIIR